LKRSFRCALGVLLRRIGFENGFISGLTMSQAAIWHAFAEKGCACLVS
jgi:hypothetical protein